MPELPEVETVARGLRPVLEGRRLVRVHQRRPDLRWPLPADFARRLEGRRVLGLRRRAKYLLADLDDGTVLIVHLGMSGRMMVSPILNTPFDAHDHVVLETDDGRQVRFNDARRFGMMDLATADDWRDHPLLRDLGPEPLEPGFDGAVLSAALAGRRTPVKAALLDQTVVAGLGNIYVCEALFRAGLSPLRTAMTVQGRRADRLAEAIRAVLTAAIEAGGSSLRDHRQVSGELGYFQHSFAVYGRESEACESCGCDVARTGGVRRTVQSGRSTFHCPRRQR